MPQSRLWIEAVGGATVSVVLFRLHVMTPGRVIERLQSVIASGQSLGAGAVVVRRVIFLNGTEPV
jgi:hypothetical protein